MRIGHGFDVHAFTKGNEIILGGVKIPFHKSFKAHSDGDVLIHAICDAMLGSLALGDIGALFPPNEAQWKGCNSDYFLKQVYKLVHDKGYELANIDCTIVCEKPKIRPYVEQIQTSIANFLNETIDKISIKATTTEKLGYCGREEGIAVHVVCLLNPKNI